MKGTVHKWNAERCFGYIKPQNPDFSDVYLSGYDIKDEQDPVGLLVEFEIAPPKDLMGAQGRARNVTVIGKSDDVGERLEGVVVHLDAERGYGFINDGHTGGRRVWFGTNSMAGQKFVVGDRVTFELTKTLRDTGRAASRVWRKST